MISAFEIHPADLRQRRRRCAPFVELLARRERAPVTACNICDSGRAAILCTTDRYGFPGRTAMCLDCGLIYNVDRLTPQGYASFYAEGAYRQITGAFKSAKQNIQRIHAAQTQYAANLLRTFDGIIPKNSQGRMLDVGGSTGRVAQEFQRQFGHRPTIVEPAAAEVAKAKSLGLDAVVGSIETWQTDEQFDVVLLCRTIEHLYDLKRALQNIRGLLKPGGLFYCDLSEFLETVRREGPPETVAKIDHVFWLTQETAPPVFRSLGFDVLSVQLTLPFDQIGFLLRAAAPRPLQPMPPPWIEETLRFLRQVNNDWVRFGTRAFNAEDWLRRRAYTLKQTLNRQRQSWAPITIHSPTEDVQGQPGRRPGDDA